MFDSTSEGFTVYIYDTCTFDHRDLNDERNCNRVTVLERLDINWKNSEEILFLFIFNFRKI